jgi:hypothetical protein
LLLVFLFLFSVSSGVLPNVASFFVNGATLLQMFKKIIQHPLTTALEGNQYPQA